MLIPNARSAMIQWLIACLALVVTGCARVAHRAEAGEGRVEHSEPFESANGQLEVSVSLSETFSGRFLFDTGIGVTLLSTTLCKRFGCESRGHYTGRRMSGQEISLDLVEASSLRFGQLQRNNELVGVFDMEKLSPGLSGALSLGFFRDAPFTIDFPAKRIVVETTASLERRRSAGVRIPVRVVADGPALTLFLPLRIEGLPTIWAELDTGSESLILDERFGAPLGIEPSSPGVRRVEGVDETGHTYVRLFTRLPVPLTIESAPTVVQRDAPVLFQKIIHDGLVGVGFLRTHVVTFDLPNGEIVIRQP